MWMGKQSKVPRTWSQRPTGKGMWMDKQKGVVRQRDDNPPS